MANEKETWSLNTIERIAYKGLKQSFIAAYMIKDILDMDANNKNE